jgi:Tfp pilus assembly protein PilF
MKKFLTVLLLAFSVASFGQGLTFEDWKKESQQNKRLLPKYGEIEKTKKEKKLDREFIADVMKKFNTENEASNHMIDLGFQYLYKGDLKTAMYRFNQAYLLDNENPNIYWGYGAVYMAFGRFDLSREQYEEGLKIDNNNDNILIDYGTTYLGEFYNYYQTDKTKANEKLDFAIEKLSKAYSVNPDNPNSSYKLSICYLYKDNCEKSKEYLELSEKIGNPNITESFKAELEEKCIQSDIDCSSIKTGKFRSFDEEVGETIIERTEKYQIEENKKYGYKLKLEVTWLDDCTYQLKPVQNMLNPDDKNLPTMVLTCKVIKLTESGYIQISSSDIDPTRIKTELTRIE